MTVSPTVTTNSLSGLDDYFFRVLRRRAAMPKDADYHFDRLGLRRVAAAVDLNNRSYTESWLADYRAAFAVGGGQVVDSVYFRRAVGCSMPTWRASCWRAGPTAS